MKKINKIIAFIVSFILVLGLFPANVFASEIDNVSYSTVNNGESLEIYSKTPEAQKIYNSLSDDEKKIFDSDLEMLIYQEKTGISYRSAGSLSSLNLPAPVLYSLQAMMSSFVAAAADGPLPFGDAALVATSVAAATTIAIYWDDVAPKWDRIVNVFKEQFSDATNTISRVFSKIKSDAKATPKPTGRKVKDVKKRLKKEGFRKTGQKGSHEQWEKGGRKVTVPNHGENSDIPVGTLRNIWKQAGWI